MEQTKIKFKRNLVKRSETTLGINFPKECVEFIEAEDGSELTIMPDTNKKGKKYVSIFIE